ncbi:MAG: hypothetical protein AAFQ37_02770, partial [Bacteroidota bacterium]
MKKIALAFTFVLFFGSVAHTQNTFANLIEVDTCANWFRADFSPPIDTSQLQWIFILQHRGATIATENNNDFGQLIDLNGTGRHELNQVLSVRGDTIFPTFRLRHDYLTTNNATQIVLQSNINGAINAPLAAPPFDGSTGGILFLASNQDLLINAPITAAAAGFRGGLESIRESECGAFTTANNFFYAANNWRGTFKGESITDPNLLTGRETGRGANLSGGGGGNDHNTGGGGGGHLRPGGDGAPNEEPGFFNCSGDFPGIGGRGLPANVEGSTRIYFGGGGGAGHSNNPNPSAGGRGGGIIVLFAQSIHFGLDASISVEGQSAAEVDGDGAGGGGAGGTILLLSDTLTQEMGGELPVFNLTGGQGGNADNNNQNRCFGPGGGGAGGQLVSLQPIPIEIFAPVIPGGLGGQSVNSNICDLGDNPGSKGSIGELSTTNFALLTPQEALDIPLTTIVEQPLCEGIPSTIGFEGLISCYRSEWFILQSNGNLTSLINSPDYTGADTPSLTILAAPVTDSVTYRLILFNAAGEAIITSDFTLVTNSLPTANFSFSFNTETEVIFDNQSINATSFQWVFANNGNSTDSIPPAIDFGTPGEYQVSLIALNACGADTTQQTITIEGAAVSA